MATRDQEGKIMAGGNKFSAEVPKGDGWGVDKAVSSAVKAIQAGQKSPLIPVIGVIDVKEIKIDPETHNVIAVVRMRRLESIDTPEEIRDAQRVLLKAWAEKRGEGAMLPFEEKEFIERAFENVNVEQIEQDEREAKEAEDMSEIDQLKRHLQAVHQVPAEQIDGHEVADLWRMHEADHKNETSGMPEHDEDDLIWRRVDLEAAEASVEDDETVELTEEGQQALEDIQAYDSEADQDD